MCAVGSEAAEAQNILPGRGSGVQSVAVGYFPVDFAYAGDAPASLRYDFSQPAWGVIYARRGMQASAAVGSQSGQPSLRLTDISVMTWRRLIVQQARRTEVYLPAILAFGYRLVSPRSDSGESLEGYNATSLSIGLGAGLNYYMRDSRYVSLRAWPSIGVVTSTFTDAYGVVYQSEADAQLHLADIFGRFGLTVGYSVRYQIWNVNTSTILSDVADELYDYNGIMHTVRAGVNF